VDILNGDRAEFLTLLRDLAQHAWRGRLIYYDPGRRGFTDFLVECAPALPGWQCEVFSSEGGPWRRVGDMAPAQAEEHVRGVFGRRPLGPEGSGGVRDPLPPARAVPAAFPPAAPVNPAGGGGQLTLL
jgi:hypothetical protein